jgi:hypothetical protein
MVEKNIRTGKPTKMFVYLPVYLETKKMGRPVEGESNVEQALQRIAIKELPFSRVEVGDSFIVKKRDDIRELINGNGELKVEQVKRSFVDSSCIVVLEKLIFKKKEEVSEFLRNKRSI